MVAERLDRRGVTGAVVTSRVRSSSSASASSSCRSCSVPHPSSAALVPPPPPSLAVPTSRPARSRSLGGSLASSWAIWAQREIGEPTLPEHGAIRSQAGDGDRERLPQTSETGEGRAPVAPAQREPGDGGIAAIPADDPPAERVDLGRPGDSQLITSRAHNTERIPARAHGTAPRGAGSAWMRVSAGCSLAAHADASDPSDDPRRGARGRFCCRVREALDGIDGLAAESDDLLLVELEAALRELFSNGRGRGGRPGVTSGLTWSARGAFRGS
jgi:hypothetical protein